MHIPDLEDIIAGLFKIVLIAVVLFATYAGGQAILASDTPHCYYISKHDMYYGVSAYHIQGRVDWESDPVHYTTTDYQELLKVAGKYPLCENVLNLESEEFPESLIIHKD